MSQWPSIKAKRLLAALFGIGWQLKRQSGSHRTLSREGWPDVVFAFHDGEESAPVCWHVSPSILASLARIFSPFSIPGAAQPVGQPDRLPAQPAGPLRASRSGGRLPQTLKL